MTPELLSDLLTIDATTEAIATFVTDREIAMIEGHLARRLKGHEGYQAIQALSGVGPILAAMFVAEISDVHRFPGPGEIRGNLVKDLAALNKVEMLSWDESGRMTAAYAGETGTCECQPPSSADSHRYASVTSQRTVGSSRRQPTPTNRTQRRRTVRTRHRGSARIRHDAPVSV